MFKFLFKLILFSCISGAISITALYFLPKEYYKQALSWVIYKQTKSQLDVKGDIKFTPFEDNVLTLFDVDLLNLSEDKQAQIKINFDSISFLRDGVTLSMVRLSKTKINFLDSAAGSDYTIYELNSDIQIPLMGRPMVASGDVVIMGEKVDYSFKVEDPEALNNGDESAVVASAQSSFFKADYNGKHRKDNKKAKVKIEVAAIDKLSMWLVDQKRVAGTAIIEGNFSVNNDDRGVDIGSLNGDINLTLMNLVQNYADIGLQKLINHLTGKSTKIDQLTASFDIKDGVVSNKDLLGIGPVQFTGAGTLNLINQQINYRIVPDVKLAKVQNLPKISPPVTITGTILNPVITVDALDVVKEIVKKPNELIKAITDVTTNNEDGKNLKKDLQNLRDEVLKDPELQKKLLNDLLGGLGKPQ